MVIDPANPPEVLPVLKEFIDSGSINFKGIINTHQYAPLFLASMM
jgi:hydroxyacylglutathione hydrolase